MSRASLLGTGAHPVERLVEHPEDRDLLERAVGIEVEEQRPLERGERELVGSERALERMAAQPADELGAAADDPRLRPAEELVAGERDEVGACGEGVPGKRLVGEREQASGAEVVDERELVAARDGGQLAGRRAAR